MTRRRRRTRIGRRCGTSAPVGDRPALRRGRADRAPRLEHSRRRVRQPLRLRSHHPQARQAARVGRVGGPRHRRVCRDRSELGHRFHHPVGVVMADVDADRLSAVVARWPRPRVWGSKRSNLVSHWRTIASRCPRARPCCASRRQAGSSTRGGCSPPSWPSATAAGCRTSWPSRSSASGDQAMGGRCARSTGTIHRGRAGGDRRRPARRRAHGPASNAVDRRRRRDSGDGEGFGGGAIAACRTALDHRRRSARIISTSSRRPSTPMVTST